MFFCLVFIYYFFVSMIVLVCLTSVLIEPKDLTSSLPARLQTPHSPVLAPLSNHYFTSPTPSVSSSTSVFHFPSPPSSPPIYLLPVAPVLPRLPALPSSPPHLYSSHSVFTFSCFSPPPVYSSTFSLLSPPFTCPSSAPPFGLPKLALYSPLTSDPLCSSHSPCHEFCLLPAPPRFSSSLSSSPSSLSTLKPQSPLPPPSSSSSSTTVRDYSPPASPLPPGVPSYFRRDRSVPEIYI